MDQDYNEGVHRREQETRLLPRSASLAEAFKCEPVRLPSTGNWVVIKRVNLNNLLRSGKIPNPLLPMAYKIIEDRQKDGVEELSEEDRLVHRQALTDSYDAMVCAVVDEPEFVLTEEEETEDSVWVGRLPEQDKITVIKLAWESAQTLSNFRDEPGAADGGRTRPEIRKVS